MTRIYHLIEEGEPFSEKNGGAISRWTANVLKDGSEIVVCPWSDTSWGFPEARIFHLPNWSRTHTVHPILYRLPWTLQKAIYLQVFRPLLDRLNPGDVLYIHNKPVCAAVLATVSRQRGFRLILHMHNSLLTRTTKRQRAAMKYLPIVFCSEFLKREFNASWSDHSGPTGLVRNGADAGKFFLSTKKRNPVPEIIFAGRLVSYKGAHVLLRAMQILKDQGVEARCSIVGGAGFGDKRPSAYVRQLARTIPGNTKLLGYRSGHELAALVREADIFCCPSIWNDPFPLAPLEGMASGLPVVASNTGGIPEALAYGGGQLVPAGNAEALAMALRQLIEDVPFREEMGRRALDAFQKHFRWSKVREQYLSFLRAVES